MKKIVMGIAAVALATSMFAADPAFDPQVTQFDGNAEVKWGVNLDTEKTGFKNSTDGNLKMQLFTNGDKSTEGEGIWADLKVKVDGDNAWKEENGAETIPTWAIDHAKIWIEKFYVGITAGDIQTKEFQPTLGLKSGDANHSIAYLGKAGSDAYTQGIIAGYDDSNLSIGVDFRSNKADQYTNDYGMAGRVELKDGNEWVPGLGVKVDVSKVLDEDTATAMSAMAAYKIAIDDTYYVKPQVAYVSTDLGDDDGTIAAAVIFGWGAEADANPGLYYFNADDPWKKITPGISVAYVAPINGFDADSYGAMEVAFYSGDIVENLKAAAFMDFGMQKDMDFEDAFNTIACAAQYAIKADDVTVTLKAGMKIGQKGLIYDDGTPGSTYDWVDDDSDETTAPIWAPTVDPVDPAPIGIDDGSFEVSVGVDVAGLINNTTFSAEYVSGNLKADPAVKGTINVGCKIAL